MGQTGARSRRDRSPHPIPSAGFPADASHRPLPSSPTFTGGRGPAPGRDMRGSLACSVERSAMAAMSCKSSICGVDMPPVGAGKLQKESVKTPQTGGPSQCEAWRMCDDATSFLRGAGLLSRHLACGSRRRNHNMDGWPMRC